MRTHRTPKIRAAVLLLAAFGVNAPAFAARQTADGSTSSSRSKRVTAKARTVKKRKPRQRVQTAPAPARISEIQSALAAQGAYKGQPNGKWDEATTQAMKNYQVTHGLTATGKLDALTLQKLGLGSEIAGRAAPLPLPQTQGAPTAGPLQQTP
jgi:peptidoglycan hydrolase-like protein with peptidoglycan-binding domain